MQHHNSLLCGCKLHESTFWIFFFIGYTEYDLLYAWWGLGMYKNTKLNERYASFCHAEDLSPSMKRTFVKDITRSILYSLQDACYFIATILVLHGLTLYHNCSFFHNPVSPIENRIAFSKYLISFCNEITWKTKTHQYL